MFVLEHIYNVYFHTLLMIHLLFLNYYVIYKPVILLSVVHKII